MSGHTRTAPDSAVRRISPVVAVIAVATIALVGLSPSSTLGASSQEGRFTSSSCTEGNPYCGAVVIINAGVYTITKTHLHHLSGGQGSDYTAAPGCTDTDKEFSNDLPAGNYYTFVVPADCGYTAKVNIKDGPKKDKNILLTPGCLLKVEATGTLFSNKFKVQKAEWTDAAKQAGRSGPVVDAAGRKCGSYGDR